NMDLSSKENEHLENSIRHSEQIKTIFDWRNKVDKKLDRIETTMRIEITAMFITIATVLIKVFS
ncbi:MAG: hypothetical protein LC658_03735, partial [Bacteroidales bacterium]|nr:hypothetical protein [Bacteroidales bacterium]